MTRLVRTLIATHVVVFAAGFVVGKSIDSDELELYRDAHESTLTRLKRKATAAGLGVLAAGTLVLIIRGAVRSRRE